MEKGEKLDDLDIQFLQDVFDDAKAARTLLARHPELEDIASKVAALYHDIGKLRRPQDNRKRTTLELARALRTAPTRASREELLLLQNR